MKANVSETKKTKKPLNKKEQLLKKRIEDLKKAIAFQDSVIDRLEKN